MRRKYHWHQMPLCGLFVRMRPNSPGQLHADPGLRILLEANWREQQTDDCYLHPEYTGAGGFDSHDTGVSGKSWDLRGQDSSGTARRGELIMEKILKNAVSVTLGIILFFVLLWGFFFYLNNYTETGRRNNESLQRMLDQINAENALRGIPPEKVGG